MLRPGEKLCLPVCERVLEGLSHRYVLGGEPVQLPGSSQTKSKCYCVDYCEDILGSEVEKFSSPVFQGRGCVSVCLCHSWYLFAALKLLKGRELVS